MKIPCEVVVWYVLPIVRREVASELVNVHHMSQAEVARKFGVTDAAISQYLKKKRGDSFIIENSSKYPEFISKIREAAGLIAEGKATFEEEMCKVCRIVRDMGLLDEIYMQLFGVPAIECCNMCRHVLVEERTY
jgi:hypothetical protein